MSLVKLLNIGTVGSAVAQQGVAVASQNLSNVGTEGYSRKQANLRPELGGGGETSARRVIEPFVERRLLTAQSASGEASAELLGLTPLDAVFADGDGSLGAAMDKFQASMQDLAARPADAAVRQQVLANADNVSSAFQNMAAGLEQARSDANQRIGGAINEVNQRLKQIAQLNGQIGKAEIGGGEAADLRDRRDQLVREVSERVPVTVNESASGFSLSLGGALNLVSIDGKVNELKMADGVVEARVTMTVAGAQQDVTSLLKGGSIGGQLKARDGALKELTDKLDQLAFDFANQYNSVHAAGEGLDGVDNRNLFVAPPQVQGAARNLTVSADVAGNPDALAAGTAGSGLKSDNRNAMALSELSNGRFALGTMTVTEALASLTARAGMAVQSAQNAESFASGALEQVSNLRDTMSGVSSDEEMVSMMRFQQAYSASLQIIKVADEMMGELMNLRR